MHEFDLIKRYFLPLSQSEAGTLALSDDAAVIAHKEGVELVYTKDVMIAGVHFFADDNPFILAQKLLAVNVSDLCAMGATPRGYLLGLALPQNSQETWLADFASGLKKGIERFGGVLLGGDTTVHQDKSVAVLSLTAVGEVAQGEVLKRSGAVVGDDVYVTGHIGDAMLGLKLLQDESLKQAFSKTHRDELLSCYHLPSPRQEWSQLLFGVATSCADISDGLVSDAGHIANASKVAIEIAVENIPLSEAARLSISKNITNIESLITGGDDYELVFTAPLSMRMPIKSLAQSLDVCATRIGVVTSGEGVQVMRGGKAVLLEKTGYQHQCDPHS